MILTIQILLPGRGISQHISKSLKLRSCLTEITHGNFLHVCVEGP